MVFRLQAKLFLSQCVVNQNMDRAVEEALNKSMEGIFEDFQPVVSTDRALYVLEEQTELLFSKERQILAPVLLLVEKGKVSYYSRERGEWEQRELFGLNETEVRDEINAIAEELMNEVRGIKNKGIRYQLFLPYTEGEEWHQGLLPLSLWCFYQSPVYRAGDRIYFYFVSSGARLKRTDKIE